jgi:hypothetical protein
MLVRCPSRSINLAGKFKTFFMASSGFGSRRFPRPNGFEQTPFLNFELCGGSALAEPAWCGPGGSAGDYPSVASNGLQSFLALEIPK